MDLTCAYRTINVNQAARDGEYYVHEGMYEAALGLCAQDSRVHRTVASALAQYPTYGLVICGHSLGGGVAALLALLTAIPASSYTTTAPAHPSGAFVTSPASGLPPGRPIHCYAYGPPAVMSPDLARYTEGLVSSIVKDSDLIPCLSLGTLRDLKNIAVTMSEEQGLAEEVFSRVSPPSVVELTGRWWECTKTRCLGTSNLRMPTVWQTGSLRSSAHFGRICTTTSCTRPV